MDVIKIEFPECLPLELLKKKIDDLVREEDVRLLLFERSVEELNLGNADLAELECFRDRVWKEEKKKLGL